jgi:hypothetical protein
MRCHAVVGINVKWSARLLSVGHAVVKKTRKHEGLRIPTAKECNRGWALRQGRARKHLWGKINPSTLQEWQEWAFRTEQEAWKRRAKTIDDWERGVGSYWRNRDLSRTKAAERARQTYQQTKDTPEARFKRAMRNAVKRITRISKTKKAGRTIDFIGCSMAQARRHIERQFTSGMNWSNHGTVWHIDHIIPLARFNLLDPLQRRRANHYTNLQPLCAIENMRKGDKIIGEHQIALL